MCTRLPGICAALLIAASGLARAELPDGSVWLQHVQRDLLPWWLQPAAQGQPVGRFPTFRCNDGAAYVAERPCAELKNAPDWIRSELGDAPRWRACGSKPYRRYIRAPTLPAKR